MPDAVVAIHQPNFLPWLGYFEKIAKADIFVLLDDVQFPKKGGTWINRVYISQNGTAKFLTAPVNRSYNGTRSVNEMSFSANLNWREDCLKALSASYRKAPFFTELMPFFEDLIVNPENKIAEYNIDALNTLIDRIGLAQPTFVRSSTLGITSSRTQRLIDITRAVGGAVYLCGDGTSGYQDDTLFEAAGITLRYNNFVPQPYPQYGTGSFIPGLSIVDALFNMGSAGVFSLLKPA